MQTKLKSLIEAKMNVIVGAPINYTLNFYLIGLLQKPLANKEHWAFITMSLSFTVVAIIRSYLIRRYFNRSAR